MKIAAEKDRRPVSAKEETGLPAIHPSTVMQNGMFRISTAEFAKISGVVGIALLIMMVIAALRNDGNTPVTTGALILSVSASLALFSKGHYQSAFIVFVVSTFVMVTWQMTRTDGIYNSASFAYPCLLAVCGLLLTRRYLVMLLVMSSTAYFAIWIAMGSGHVRSIPLPHTAAQVIYPVMLMILVSLITGYISSRLHSNASRLGELEEEMARLAVQAEYRDKYDVVSGLPNGSTTENLAKVLLQTDSESRKVSGVVLVALDNFNRRSEILSQPAIDELVRQLSKRIVNSVGPNALVGRLETQRFVVILNGMNDPTEATPIAVQILKSIREPITLEGDTIHQTCSIGIASSDDTGWSYEVMLREASQALAMAKEGGRDTHRFFNPELNSHIFGNIDLKSSLLDAIDQDQITLHYHPAYSLIDGRIVSVEARLRWYHPSVGMVETKKLIGAAYAGSVMPQLEEWALSKLVQQIADWKHSPMRDVVVSAAITPTLIRRGTLFSVLQSLLERHRVQPNALSIEIANSDFVGLINSEVESLTDLNRLGVSISVNNVGQAFTNFKVLAQAGIKKIKLNEALVREIAVTDKAKVVIEATIAAASELGIRVEATGVDSEIIKEALGKTTCTSAQGLIYSRAVPAEEVEMMVLLSQKNDTGDSLEA